MGQEDPFPRWLTHMAGRLMLPKLGASVPLHMSLSTRHFYCLLIVWLFQGKAIPETKMKAAILYDLALEIIQHPLPHNLLVDAVIKFQVEEM